MKRTVLCGLTLLVAMSLAAAQAGAPAGAGGTAEEGIIPLPLVLGNKIIATGQTLHIVAWTSDSVVVNAVVTVNDEGMADIPHLGLLPVAGKRLAELQTTLASVYSRQFPGSVVYLMPEGTLVGRGQALPQGLKLDAATQTIAPSIPLLDRVLAAGDRLHVKVWTGEEVHLEVDVVVSAKLTIALPPLGMVPAQDQTLTTLRDELLARYRRYYPRASVEVLLATGEAGAVQVPAVPLPAEIPVWQKFPPEVTATQILAALPRFGASVFAPSETAQPERPAPGAPLVNAPIPPDYLIGPGDRLAVRNWTGAVEHFSGDVIVTPDSKIYLPLLGEVALGGQTLGQATALLAQRFGKFYTGSQTTISVTEMRTVEVYVTGDANLPGKYVLPGTATVFTALYAAGGPSPVGSLRNIRLTRRGQKSLQVDLYAYLLTGEREGDEPLLPGDTIFIAPATDSIGVAGLVRRPALYEIKDEITIAEALKMAAGVDPRGYGRNIEVWRVDRNTDWNVVNVDLGKEAGPQFKLRTGDLVLVRSVLEKPANIVEITGAVRRPGIYEVGETLDLATALDRAQGLEEGAYVQQGAVMRLTPEHEYRMLRFNVQAALERRQPDNLTLQAGDRVFIYTRDEVSQRQEVGISGAVASPGIFPWAKDMRVSDLLLQGKGLLPGAHTLRADLQRLDAEQKQQLLVVNLARVLAGDAEADLTLQPGDQLVVFTQRDVGVASEVVIAGPVQRPGVYERKQGMKVSDLIYQAGGLQPEAGNVIEYTRGRVAGPAQITQLELKTDGEKFAVTPDVVLADDDHVAVIANGDFRTRPLLAMVDGMVAKPGTYALMKSPEEEDTVYRLLMRAGGPLPEANPAGIVLYRQKETLITQGQKDDVGQVLKAFNREGSSTEPSLTPEKNRAMAGSVTQRLMSVFGGSDGEAVVVIPPRELSSDTWANAVPIDGGKLMATAGKEGDIPLAPGDIVVVPELPTTVAVIGAVVRPGAIKYQGPLSPLQYVALAGGPAADAIMRRIVVIRANGAVVATAEAKEVQAGDVVVVPSDFMVRKLGGPSQWQRVLQTIAAIGTAFILR